MVKVVKVDLANTIKSRSELFQDNQSNSSQEQLHKAAKAQNMADLSLFESRKQSQKSTNS